MKNKALEYIKEYVKIANNIVHKLIAQLKEIISRLNLGNKLKDLPRINKRYKYSAVIIVFIIALFVYLFAFHPTVKAYEVYLNGKRVGFFAIKDDLLNNYAREKNIVMNEMIISKNNLDPIEKLDSLINKKEQIAADAYEIKINGYEGKSLLLASNEEVDKVLNYFKDKYAAKKTFDQETVNEVKLVENYTIEPVYGEQQTISVDEAIRIIQTGTDEKKTYKLQAGENTNSVAKKFGLTRENVLKANPQIVGRESKLQIGEELNLIVPKPLLTVEVYKTAVFTEKIPFDTKVSQTDEEYKTYYKITTKGEEGEAKVNANIVEENGQINKNRTAVLERTVIKNPKTQEALQGILQVPPKKATGTFRNPVYGLAISSGYGSRGGGFHYGIDVPKPVGTSIYASDGGVIEEINYNRYESTGLMIKINHENGYETRYLHLSRIDVNEGERVYPGQQIGAVGNTGNSTGPHLHFEIYRNGSPINPSSLLR